LPFDHVERQGRRSGNQGEGEGPPGFLRNLAMRKRGGAGGGGAQGRSGEVASPEGKRTKKKDSFGVPKGDTDGATGHRVDDKKSTIWEGTASECLDFGGGSQTGESGGLVGFGREGQTFHGDSTPKKGKNIYKSL